MYRSSTSRVDVSDELFQAGDEFRNSDIVGGLLIVVAELLELINWC